VRAFLIWRGLDAWRSEHAHVRIEEGRLDGHGAQIGVEPEPYELRYELVTGEGYVTRSISLTARGGDWQRELTLIRHDDGSWTANGEPVNEVDGALDCDVANCPLTNSMPVLRDRLLDGGEPREYVMAWIAVPELTVHRSEQRYEPIDSSRVRYVGLDSDFTAELEFDEHGLVVSYPGMAERVHAVSSPAG
jgi:uncharacterized protein